MQNYRSGHFEVAEVPVPMLREGFVLVRTRASLISAGTERQQVEFARASLPAKAAARPDLVRKALNKVRRDGVIETATALFARLDAPGPLGYSLSGVVVEVHRSVSDLAPGDRVACAGAGYANHAEFNAVPRNLCVRLPDDVGDEDAAFVTLGAIAMQGVRQAQPTLDERFAVIGLGLVGQLTVQLLKANGCRVLGIDPRPDLVELALKLGADRAVAAASSATADDFTDGVGVDGVIIAAATPSSEPLATASQLCRAKGRVVVVGLVGMDIEREAFYRKELDLRMSMSYGPGRYDPSYEEMGHDYPLAYVRWTEERNMSAFVHLLRTGRVICDALVSHRFPVTSAEQAYRLLTGGQQTLGILLSYSSEAALTRRVEVKSAAPKASGTPVGVAAIGAGVFARTVLLPRLRRVRDVRLTGIITASGTTARHAAGKFGFAFAATDSNELLKDDSTDAVVIATRHSTHAQLSIAALAAGKHVFCEKPVAIIEPELDDVVAAAEASNRVFCVGFNRRCSPYMQAIKAWLSPHRGPIMISYRVSAGTLPPASWQAGQEGGGRIIGEVCHFVDSMVYLTGCAVKSVTARSMPGAGDSVVATLSFADGSVGAITYASLGDPALPKERLEVFAAGRTAVLDDFRTLRLLGEGGRRRKSSLLRDKGHANLLSAFIDAVAGRGPVPMHLREIANVSATTFAIQKAIARREAVEVGWSDW